MSNVDYSLFDKVSHSLDKKGRGSHDGGSSEPPEGGNMEARVAKLESIAENTIKVLDGLRADAKEFRADMRSDMKDLRSDARDLRNDSSSNFKWIVGIQITTLLGILGILAKAAEIF